MSPGRERPIGCLLLLVFEEGRSCEMSQIRILVVNQMGIARIEKHLSFPFSGFKRRR